MSEKIEARRLECGREVVSEGKKKKESSIIDR